MEEKKKKGFAAMDPAQVKAIASKGGKMANANGNAHRFTKEEARKAALKGVEMKREKARIKAMDEDESPLLLDEEDYRNIS